MATLEEIRRARAADRAGQTQAQGGNSTLSAIRAAREADRGPMPAVQTPDGRSTAPGTSQDQADNVPPGMVFDPRTGGYVDTALAAERMGKAQGASASFIAGAPFVGEYADEALGRVDAAVSGRNPEIAQETMRQSRQQFQQSNPGLALTSEIAGGVTGSLPFLAGGAGLVSQAKTLPGKVLAATGLGAAFGGTEGAIQGYGAGTTPETRGAEAWQRGIIGAGLGGVLGAIAPILGKAAKGAVDSIKKLDVSVIADEFGISKGAARAVRGYLANDDLDAAARALASRGDDAMLAEAGPATRQMLDNSMASGGGALSTARPRVDQRVQQASTRFARTLDDTLGTADGGIKGSATEIARSTRPQRKAAYDFAYRQPTPMAGKAGQQLDGVLRRIDPDDFRSAISEAAKEARNDGIENLNIMASFDDAGNVTFSQPPSVMELDYLARGLNNLVDAGTDKVTGQMSPAARRASSQATALRDILKDNVEGYRTALKLGGDKIRATEALTMGRRLLSETATVEDVRNVMRDATPDVKAAARKGLRENIEAVMGRARTTIADLEAGNMDFETGTNAVAEAVAATRNLLVGDNIKKMRFVLGADDARRLFDEVSKVSDALVLRSAVARGSATAIRTAGQQAMADQVAPGAARRAIGNMGNPLEGAREVTQSLAGIDPASISSAQQGYFAEIADALTRLRGPDAQRALAAVRGAMAGEPMRQEQAEQIVRLLGLPALAGGLQSATRLTERTISN